MAFPDSLLTVFSAEIDRQDGLPVVTLPEREVRMGDIAVGDTYRIAILPQTDGGSVAGDRGPATGRQVGRAGSGPPVEEGEVRAVEIEDVGDQGDGIARVGPGYIVFVPDTDVGDRVTVEISQARDNFAFAEVVEGEPTKE